MEVVKLIQPHELGSHFRKVDGQWKVNFPPQNLSGIEISKDPDNFIQLGEDGGMFANATHLYGYALVQDNDNMKIHLYRYPANEDFAIGTATLIGSIDMIELNGRFDDITITDAVVTFYDVQSENELEFDTNMFQKVEALIGSDSVVIDQVPSLDPEAEGRLANRLQVKVVDDHSNKMVVRPNGLYVGPLNELNIDHSLVAVPILDSSENNPEIDYFEHTINGDRLRIPAVTLRNARGKTLAAITKAITTKLHCEVIAET